MLVTNLWGRIVGDELGRPISVQLSAGLRRAAKYRSDKSTKVHADINVATRTISILPYEQGEHVTVTKSGSVYLGSELDKLHMGVEAFHNAPFRAVVNENRIITLYPYERVEIRRGQRERRSLPLRVIERAARQKVRKQDAVELLALAGVTGDGLPEPEELGEQGLPEKETYLDIFGDWETAKAFAAFRMRSLQKISKEERAKRFEDLKATVNHSPLNPNGL